MTREEALRELELAPEANRYQIEQRYLRLIKRYQHDDSDEGKSSMEKINAAYAVLTEEPRPEEKDPRLQREVAGKSVYQWKNILYYARKPAIVVLLAAGLLIWIVYDIRSNEQPDFNVAAIGTFLDELANEDEVYGLTEFILDETSFVNPVLEVIITSSSVDPSFAAAGLMKRTIYASGTQECDLMILDRENFDLFESEGLFRDLTDLYEDLQREYPEETDKFVRPLYHVSVLDEETHDVIEILSPEAARTAGRPIVGLDLSQEQLLGGLGLIGYEQILTVTVHEEEPEAAHELIRLLISRAEDIIRMQSTIASPSPTPTPVLLPETTAAGN